MKHCAIRSAFLTWGSFHLTNSNRSSVLYSKTPRRMNLYKGGRPQGRLRSKHLMLALAGTRLQDVGSFSNLPPLNWCLCTFQNTLFKGKPRPKRKWAQLLSLHLSMVDMPWRMLRAAYNRSVALLRVCVCMSVGFLVSLCLIIKVQSPGAPRALISPPPSPHYPASLLVRYRSHNCCIIITVTDSRYRALGGQTAEETQEQRERWEAMGGGGDRDQRERRVAIEGEG
jgi:hypothetical protein